MSAIPLSDTLALVALTVSVIALGVSIFALWLSENYRRRDLLVEIAREREPLEEQIRSLRTGVADLRPDIFMRSFTRLKSTDEELLDAEVERLWKEVQSLQQNLSTIPKPDGLLGRFRAESALTSMIKVRVRADALKEDIELCRGKVASLKRIRFPVLR